MDPADLPRDPGDPTPDAPNADAPDADAPDASRAAAPASGGEDAAVTEATAADANGAEPGTAAEPPADGANASPRPDPLTLARRVVDERWPDAPLALLAGSVVRGAGTADSDLDLVIVLDATPERGAYRSSFVLEGWPVEAFVHSEATLARFQTSDAARRRPSLLQMVAEGRVLRDVDGRAARLKQTATARLAAGPEPLAADALERARYRLGDLLADLRGAGDLARPVVAAETALAAAEFALDLGGHWRGGSSWTVRRLEALSPGLGRALSGALAAACSGDTAPLEAFVERVAAPAGGVLFDGYESHEHEAHDDEAREQDPDPAPSGH